MVKFYEFNYLDNRRKFVNRLKLVLPSSDHREILMDYKREFIENGDSMDGTAGLKDADSFEEWYRAFCDNSKEETVRGGLVPASTFMAINTNNSRLIGMIDIRHRLNDYLFNFGGHIGYSIRKSERQKGYASEMLGLALNECLKLNIKNVLITCNKDNIASAKTIINNSGKLEREIQEGNRITQRYWITLDQD
jgi:predicted acetyltransferase